MKTFNAYKFIATLKVWRRMNGMSMAELAEIAEIAKSTYGFIETGDRPPTIAELQKLCSVVEFEVSEFFDNEKK